MDDKNCEQPNWDVITKLCSKKIQAKYPEYGNTWLDYLDKEFWNKRLQGEVNEAKQLSGFLDHDRKIGELVDIINVCAMQITNISRDKQKQYWDEVVAMRLGVG